MLKDLTNRVVVCATLMIHNKAPVACSLCILAYDIIDSLELLSEVFLTGQLVLNELIMKKLALFGCTCLLVAHSVKDTVNVNHYAGLLFEDDDKKNKKERQKEVKAAATHTHTHTRALPAPHPRCNERCSRFLPTEAAAASAAAARCVPKASLV